MCLRRSIISLKPGLFAAALCCSLNPAQAEYRLQGGDVIEISVSGVPELRQRASVQLDGSITFPVVGAFMVEGVEFSEVRSKIQSAVASKIFRIRTPDGRELSRMFERDEVAATIVEYRPVFISGDVTRPGEQTFRPRMTVRQALASAGGFSALARANATSFDAANLRSEYITVWLNLAREHVRVWRIKTELGKNIELDPKAIPPAPVSDAAISQIVNLEIEYRAASTADHERAKDFLRRSIEQAGKHTLVLAEQKQSEDEGVQADTRSSRRPGQPMATAPCRAPRGRGPSGCAVLFDPPTADHHPTHASESDSRRVGERAREDRRSAPDTFAGGVAGRHGEAGRRARKAAGRGGKAPTGWPETSADFGQRQQGRYHGVQNRQNGKERHTVEADSELQPGDVVEVACVRKASISPREKTPVAKAPIGAGAESEMPRGIVAYCTRPSPSLEVILKAIFSNPE